MSTAPLAGIRVLEVANWLAAPSCAALLADLGADVVKVEPPQGDAYRYLTMASSGYSYDFQTCPGFEMDNRGKQSITLDLAKPGARAVLMRLAATSDVIVTNLVNERRANYGFTAETVHAVNPQAIFASVTGYGSEGPDADRPGWDHTSFWARSGIMGLMGEAGSAPSSCRGGMGDHTAALNLLSAILVALRLRDQTGEGQVVDVALQQTGMWSLGLDLMGALISREDPKKKKRSEAQNPMANVYQCKDGRWILLLMPTPDYWPRFSEVIGKPEWADDERYNTTEGRGEHARDLIPEVEKIFTTRDYADWMRVMDEAKLIYAPVPRVTEVIEDPQPRAMGAFAKLDHPILGDVEIIDTPFKVHGADIGVRGPAPTVGEHTFAVLENLGIDPDDIANYASEGAFG